MEEENIQQKSVLQKSWFWVIVVIILLATAGGFYFYYTFVPCATPECYDILPVDDSLSSELPVGVEVVEG